VLGFDDEHFQPARGDDAEIRIGHIDLSTTAATLSQTPRAVPVVFRPAGTVGWQAWQGNGPAKSVVMCMLPAIRDRHRSLVARSLE
jgi:hypothetical protein